MVSNRVIEKISFEIITVFRTALDSGESVNRKSNTTLIPSNLFNDAYVEYKEGSNEFVLYMNNYIDYIIRGRKPLTRKVPVRALKKWASERGIPTDNNTLYAIRESIYQEGIRPRNVLGAFEEILDKKIDSLLDELVESIITNINNFFNK